MGPSKERVRLACPLSPSVLLEERIIPYSNDIIKSSFGPEYYGARCKLLKCKFVDNILITPHLEIVGGTHATNFHPLSSAVLILLFPLRPGLPDSLLGIAVYKLNKKENRRQLRGAV
jgi:hypothetical protein